MNHAIGLVQGDTQMMVITIHWGAEVMGWGYQGREKTKTATEGSNSGFWRKGFLSDLWKPLWEPTLTLLTPCGSHMAGIWATWANHLASCIYNEIDDVRGFESWTPTAGSGGQGLLETTTLLMSNSQANKCRIWYPRSQCRGLRARACSEHITEGLSLPPGQWSHPPGVQSPLCPMKMLPYHDCSIYHIAGLAVQTAWVHTQLPWAWVAWTWASYLAPLCLSFLKCKMELLAGFTKLIIPIGACSRPGI